jgi:hypothetical protein
MTRSSTFLFQLRPVQYRDLPTDVADDTELVQLAGGFGAPKHRTRVPAGIRCSIVARPACAVAPGHCREIARPIAEARPVLE